MDSLRTATLALVLLLPVSGRAASFAWNSYSIDPFSSPGNVRFQIEFNAVPNFSLADQFGRMANAFQFTIYDSLVAPRQVESVVRGAELFDSGDRLRVRDGSGKGQDSPHWGGWGAAIGAVPYQLSGPQLSFQIPLSMLAPSSPNGIFLYQFATYEYGITTASIFTRTDVPDTGNAFVLFACALAVMLLPRRFRS